MAGYATIKKMRKESSCNAARSQGEKPVSENHFFSVADKAWNLSICDSDPTMALHTVCLMAPKRVPSSQNLRVLKSQALWWCVAWMFQLCIAPRTPARFMQRISALSWRTSCRQKVQPTNWQNLRFEKAAESEDDISCATCAQPRKRHQNQETTGVPAQVAFWAIWEGCSIVGGRSNFEPPKGWVTGTNHLHVGTRRGSKTYICTALLKMNF